ncbi:MAG: ABC transporter ATP-binding protein [Chloroflexota bacterium]|nr:ABC transporter ATP-binding protein [Chloroflexota bacterium]
MTALLEAHNLTKVFGGGLLSRRRTVALDNISLVISGDRPSVISIAGESGSGKTTLARLLLGITHPSSGRVLYRGKELKKLSREEWKVFRREVQAIFQDPFEAFNPFYKVDNVLNTPIVKFRLARSRSERREMVDKVLDMVGLRPEETLGRYPHQLSGGQRQRVMVARALLPNPKILLADEPVSMVDASLRATILGTLLKLSRELNISLVYVTHDLTTAYQVAETILVLYQGSPVEVGDVEKVIRSSQHPYTRLLVGSIPLPNPKLKWGTEAIETERTGRGSGAGNGCRFAGRCPVVMPVCHEQRPPLYRTDSRRATACFLYKESPAVEGVELMSALSRGTQTSARDG